ncbi:V-type proton ATPase subunit e-like [Lycorma delicatula]|uniref:V-type proton ATPase subunit e-like n=1 Tax=Lycorma delicatula TaxID=130591 RepID=UPI003F515839
MVALSEEEVDQSDEEFDSDDSYNAEDEIEHSEHDRFWVVVGLICPLLVPRGPNKGLVQLVLMLTAVTSYSFWLIVYLSQVNPLMGPKVTNNTFLLLARKWEKDYQKVKLRKSSDHSVHNFDMSIA